MKIMVCGKGGCGKSTVTTLLARSLAEKGQRVLVIDMDESNFGLHRQLGLSLPTDFTLYFGSKKGIYKVMDDPFATEGPFGDGWTFEDLPTDYISTDGKIALLSIGKIHDAEEGCACAMGTVAKQLLANLILGNDDIVLVDAEAGVEHFGRGIDREVDAILMVVDPSFESLSLSQKIYGMCTALGKEINYIINKADPDQAAVLERNIYDPELILATVPLDKEIQTAGLFGKAITTEVESIRKMTEGFLEQY